MRDHWFDELARETVRSQSRRALLQRLGRGLGGALLAAAGAGAARAAGVKGPGIINGTGSGSGSSPNNVTCAEKCMLAATFCTLGCTPLESKLQQDEAAEKAVREAYQQASCNTALPPSPTACQSLTAALGQATQAVEADKHALRECAADCRKKENACVKACSSPSSSSSPVGHR